MTRELPVLERAITSERMVAYAGATWDWHRLHHDRSYADPPVVDGQMLGALVAEQILDAFGPRAFIAELSFRFTSMVHAGETVRVEGSAGEDGDALRTTHRVLAGDRPAAEAAALVYRDGPPA